MLFFAAIAAMAVAANAQSIRISPAVIGSTAPGAEHVIALAAGGSAPVHHVPVHHQKVVTVAKHEIPQIVAAPQTYTIAAPQTYHVAQPIAHKLVHVAEPTVYKRVVAQPIVKVQTLAHPTIVAHQQPIVKVAPLKAHTEEQFEIQPYAFGFDSVDEYGAKHGRQENKDANGVVTGTYTLSAADGITRVVSYVADHEGFRASVKTNEPGTLTSAPAGVQVESSASVPARR